MSINLNLLPWREELKEKRKRDFFLLLGTAAISALILMIFLHLYVNGQIAFQREINTILKKEIAILDGEIESIESLQEEKQQLLARMEVIQRLQRNRPHIVHLFDSIVHTVPKGLYLTSLTRKGEELLIDGNAESNTRVSTFMRNIEASTWISAPMLTLIQADEQEQEGVKPTEHAIKFNLEAQVGDGDNEFDDFEDVILESG